MANALLIRTPEGVVFSFPLAGPVARCLAVLVDFLLILAITTVFGSALLWVNAFSPDLAVALTILASFLIHFGYAIAQEWFWRGQTVGKRLFAIRVMDAQGLNLAFHQILLRNLLRTVDIMPVFYFLGGLSSLASPLAQRLGDIAAGTVVVRTRMSDEPDLAQLRSPKYNSLRELSHLIARIRRRISPQEAGIALQAVLRRDELEPDARVKLFDELADYFRRQAPILEPLGVSISSEQFVRNIVDALFTRPTATGGMDDKL